MLAHEWLASASPWYYATVHVPALIAFLVWLFVRHRDQFPHWRNGLALLTAGCLVIRFVRVAPPRFFPDLGYENLAQHYGVSVYGERRPERGLRPVRRDALDPRRLGRGRVLGIIAASTSGWRWVFLLHLILTTLVVSATANHWWLDGIVAVVLLLVGLAVDTAVRRYLASRKAPDPVPVAVAA